MSIKKKIKKSTYACHVIKNEDYMFSWPLRGVIEGIFTIRGGIKIFVQG
jgi:hypothetical protein